MSGSVDTEGGRVEGAAPGERLGGYRLVRLVGAGGMGVVWEAWDEALKRRVALKVLGGAARGPQALERFRQEATLAARLRHPNIVVVHEAGDDRGRAFIAMEFVEGRTLEQEIDARLGEAAHLEGPAREAARREAVRGMDRAAMRRAASIARDVARALHAGHVHTAPGADAPTPIVHRDVKPGNVVVDAAGSAKLLDYGLAKETGVALTVTREALGTPLYMSPEQLFSARRVGPRSDVYSLGMTLQACLTLARPFEESQAGRLFEHILRHDPRDVQALHAGVPDELATIIRTAIAKDERVRYPTAAALADDLEAWLEGRPIVARPPGRLARLRRRLRRHPVALGGPLVVTLAASVAWPTTLLLEARALQEAAEAAAAADYEASLLRARQQDEVRRCFDAAGALFSLAAQAKAKEEPDERWLAMLNEGSSQERHGLTILNQLWGYAPPDLQRRAMLAARARGDTGAERGLARLVEDARGARADLADHRRVVDALAGRDREALGRDLLLASGVVVGRRASVDLDPDLLAGLALVRRHMPRFLDPRDLAGSPPAPGLVADELLDRLRSRMAQLAPKAASVAGLEGDLLGQLGKGTVRVVPAPGCGPLDGLRVTLRTGGRTVGEGAPWDPIAVDAPGDLVVSVTASDGRAILLPAHLPRPAWGAPPPVLRVALPARPQDAPPGTVLAAGADGPPVWIEEREVSCAEYAAFVDAGHASCPADERATFPAGKDHRPSGSFDAASARPVTGVDWWDARAYAAWRGRRLPTAAEWARAAGPLDRLGGANLAGIDDGALWGDGAVGHAAPCGARDLVGGVAEWLAGDDSTRFREAGGGSWATPAPPARERARLVERLDPLARGADVGLRCVVDLPPAATPAPRRERVGRPMRAVAGGEVELRTGGWSDRSPPRVEVSPFLIDVSPVTRGDLLRFARAVRLSGGPSPFARPDAEAALEQGDPAAPAVMTWVEAQAYAAWEGKRLPTEAEWVAAGLDLGPGDEWCQDAWFADLRWLPRRDPVVGWPSDVHVRRRSATVRRPGTGQSGEVAGLRCVVDEEGR